MYMYVYKVISYVCACMYSHKLCMYGHNLSKFGCMLISYVYMYGHTLIIYVCMLISYVCLVIRMFVYVWSLECLCMFINILV